MATFIVRADKASDLIVTSAKNGLRLPISELDEAIYVTQVADLRDAYESRFGEDTWFDLKPVTKAELIRTASSYLGGLNDGIYDCTDALTASLRFTLGDLPDELED